MLLASKGYPVTRPQGGWPSARTEWLLTHQIIVIHSHTEAKTSEVYTKGVERWTLAADAMRTLEDMEW